MKRYKLLKDLPFAKAGTVFTRNTFKSKDGLSDYDYLETHILLDGDQDETCFGLKRNYFINNFDEWFKEEPKIYFTIDFFRKEIAKVSEKEIMGYAIDNVKSLGLLFETQEKAKKHLKYLQAKEVIRKDTKGFKTDWSDKRRNGYYFGTWNHHSEEPSADSYSRMRISSIKFKTRKDIEESFKNHPDEWKTYLTYEQ